jgi:phage shock protein A
MGADEPLEGEIVEEETAPPVPPVTDYDDAGVPSFEYVRDRIAGRAGGAELAGESAEAKSVDTQLAERERAGREKLAEIRRAMRGE